MYLAQIMLSCCVITGDSQIKVGILLTSVSAPPFCHEEILLKRRGTLEDIFF